MKAQAVKLLSKKGTLIVLFTLFALGASVQALFSGPKTYVENGPAYKVYNNYTIFERSYHHLVEGNDLYIAYPEEHWDLYKYTPTFSAFFGIFALLPDAIGLSLWNLLNALVLLFAVYHLPKLGDLEKGMVLLIVLLELMTSMQNDQSNGLIAGLLVLAFGSLERKNYGVATFCIVFSGFIKIFGIVGFVLFLFYPKKVRSAIYTLGWTALLLVIPLLFVSMDQYVSLFDSYFHMLSEDHSASHGYSVMGWLNSWFGLEVNKNLIVASGAVLFMLPMAWRRKYDLLEFRYLTLASVLLWIVIFNHKAESPTFVIAMTGVALWFVVGLKRDVDIVLFIAAMVLTSLSPTDIFPQSIREEFVKPYVLKAVPCILIWAKLIHDQFRMKAPMEQVRA